MDRLAELTRESFCAIACLREMEEPVASPENVQERLRTCIEHCKERSHRLGIPEKDLQDAVYALVALMDEVALGAPEPLRGFFISHPLQFQIFGESAAGEGFFNRLDRLMVDGRRLDVLGIYHLCLLFGFQGKYAFPGGDIELLRIAEGVRNQVQGMAEAPSLLAPAGAAPDEPLVRRDGRRPLLWASLGIFALALVLFVGLRVSFNHQAAGFGNRVDEIAP